MKKIVWFLLFLLVVPLGVSATTFDLNDTDMSIEFDEDIWYVFTPDNIKDNAELDELGISYEYMVETFQTNEAYLDAVLFYQDSEDYIEIFVRKTKLDDIQNLMNYDDDFINELGNALAEEQNANYKIYQKDYPFIKLDYIDQGFYLNEYYTIVNGDAYTITAQKPYSFNEEDELRVQEIIDSVEFDVDTSLKEPSSISWSTIFKYAMIGALVGALITYLVKLVNKKEKNEG